MLRGKNIKNMISWTTSFDTSVDILCTVIQISAKINTGDYARYAITLASIAPHFLLFTIMYFFFFSSSFLYFSFLFLLVIYVHSRVSRSVVSRLVVSIFSLKVNSHENAPESWIWPP